MKRLAATVHADVRLQVRNGFYYAVAFLLAVWAVLVISIPVFDWSPWLAPLVLGNLTMATYFFMGGLVLLEKREGTLEALIVTPLRVGEYLGSKVITLTALSVAENLIMVTLVAGFQYQLALLMLGIACASAVYVLLGFVAVARYDSINEYVMPSVLYVLLLSIPYVDYFGLWQSRWMLLHPLQGSLVLMKGAFLPVPAAELIGGFLSAVTWIVLSFVLGRRSFRRFLVRKEGVH